MNGERFAIMGDIHSNWEALCAVLEDAEKQGVTRYVCVGDIVGYNADPVKCLEKIRELDAVVVKGNHDFYCSNSEHLKDFYSLAAEVVNWTRSQLSEDQVEYLQNLKLFQRVAGFTIVHSTLDMPEKWGYVFDKLEAEASFNYQTTQICFYGHTHLPMMFEKQHEPVRKQYKKFTVEMGHRYLVNVGSVGQPRDGDPRAAYVIYDTRTREVELRRLPYDIQTTQEKIRRNGLPERLARRLELGR